MELARGVRDYPPAIQLIREELFEKARKSFEKHGFAPLATPIIEREDTLTFKFAGDEDVMHELFRLTDQGERKLALRFDLTVPLCRFVAMNKDLKFPFKRYEIGRVYRDGPIKLGRYREFWQCDADIVGSPSMLADAECIKTASDMLSQLPFAYIIKINNRKLLEAVMKHVGIQDTKKAMIIIDKLAKQPEKKIKDELCELTTKKQVETLFSLLVTQGTTNGKLKIIEDAIGSHEGIKELRELFSYLSVQAHVEFDPTLARGLNYYTGTVFEAYLVDNEVTSAVSGGGRYDNIIGQMMGGDQKVPAVGISIGIEPLTDALTREKKRFDKTSADIFIAPIKTQREASELADKLRLRGLRVDMDVMDRSISKNLDYASKLGIPFIAIIGTKELMDNVFTLRNMRTGEETRISLDLESFDITDYA